MYVSIQTVCGCHGFLLFESIYCDRCRSLIPFQLSDESLIDPVTTNGANAKTAQGSKHESNMLVPHRKPQHHGATTGRVRFRALCPFCNSSTYVLRYYCKRERLYYHLRLQSFSENEQSQYKSIAEIQTMNSNIQYDAKHDQIDSSATESIDDSYSLSGTLSHQPPSTILYDQSGAQTAKDIQIENEKTLYALNDLEGDLFNVLRNGLFYDTLIQCQDDVKLQAHRCILGGRSPWFRHLLGEYHDANTQDDYVLQMSIDDVQSAVMNEILNFIYTNRCLISLKNAPDLLIAAKRFELEKLRKQIADFLLSRLTIDNAIDMLVSAHEAGSQALKLACIRLINRNIEKIKRTEKWRTFKTEHVDLVPELYESRVERQSHAPTVFLPDVFSGPVVPSDSLLTLTQLYENPVKQRLATPTPRILPPPKSQQQLPLPHSLQTVEPITEGTSGPFAQRDDSTLSSIVDRKSPVKKTVTNNTRRQPVPPLTRTVFPTIKQPSEIDAYRRPVNIYEKSTALPSNDQNQRAGNTQVPKKPPPPVATKATRSISAKQTSQLRRSPTLSETTSDEHITSGRAISAESMG